MEAASALVRSRDGLAVVNGMSMRCYPRLVSEYRYEVAFDQKSSDGFQSSLWIWLFRSQKTGSSSRRVHPTAMASASCL